MEALKPGGPDRLAKADVHRYTPFRESVGPATHINIPATPPGGSGLR